MSVAYGLFVVIFFGAFLSLAWSAILAALQLPVSAPNPVALIISAASAFAGSAFAARASGRWWHGVMVSLAAVLLYWGGWIFAASRFRLPEALTLGIFGVGNQIFWWILLLALGAAAGFCGAGFSLRPPRVGSERPSSFPILIWTLIVALVLCGGLSLLNTRLSPEQWSFVSAGNSPAALASYFRHIREQQSSDVVGGRRLSAVSTWDGTQFDLFAFDLTSGVRAGLYDLDACDRSPCDNKNYSYYGFNALRSMRGIRRAIGSAGSPLIVFNGGAFDSGPDRAWCATHDAPLVYRGKMRYNVARPGWTLAIDNGRPGAVSMRLAASMRGLDGPNDYAICGVRSLISGGKQIAVGKDILVDGVKTSRTSLGWDGSKRLYVLIVREPDSEADSRRQSWMGDRQTGGWNEAQLARFWKLMGVSHAVNLAGGDSTQAMYKRQSPAVGSKSKGGGYVFIPSTRLGATIGYLNNRPVRMEIPTIPPYLMSRGSLNYIYLWK